MSFFSLTISDIPQAKRIEIETLVEGLNYPVTSNPNNIVIAVPPLTTAATATADAAPPAAPADPAGGGRRIVKRSKSQPKPTTTSVHTKTDDKHTDKKGVTRTVYVNSRGTRMVRKKDQTGNMVYTRITV
jgi:hypothetical protein